METSIQQTSWGQRHAEPNRMAIDCETRAIRPDQNNLPAAGEKVDIPLPSSTIDPTCTV